MSRIKTAVIAGESVPCGVCGGVESKPLFSCGDPDGISQELFTLVRCSNCGLIFVNPRPAPAEIGHFYFQAYYKKPRKYISWCVGFFDALMQSYRRRRIARSRKSGRLLDVGCGDGAFLAHMSRHGWEGWGVETSPDGVSMAGARPGLRIFDKPLLDCGLPAGHFDAVTLWHSIEHIPNPVAVLREIRRLLNDDGILFLALPNIGGWDFPLFKGRWFHLDIPRHLNQYTPETIAAVLEKAGFEVSRIRHFSWEYNLFGALQSMLNVISIQMNFLYNFLKGIKTPRSGRLKNSYDLCVAIAAVPAAIVLAVLYSSVSAACGRAGSIEVYALKKK